MQKPRRWSVAAGLLLAAAAALSSTRPAAGEKQVEARWMTREEIVAAFVGVQLAGIYPSGSPWRELVRPDGTSDYEEGGERRPGTWWMADNRFCFRYAQPNSGGCFRVIKLGANCFELYAVERDGPDGGGGPVGGAAWNGRMWREDRPATCEEKPIV